jgi:hypothetical protein
MLFEVFVVETENFLVLAEADLTSLARVKRNLEEKQEFQQEIVQKWRAKVNNQDLENSWRQYPRCLPESRSRHLEKQ